MVSNVIFDIIIYICQEENLHPRAHFSFVILIGYQGEIATKHVVDEITPYWYGIEREITETI